MAAVSGAGPVPAAEPHGEREAARVVDEPLLQVQDLVIRRGQRQVVAGVSFEVPPGGSLGIVGESGCGKSTILRAIAGIDQDWDGNIRILGEPLGHRRSMADRRRMQLVFQDPLAALNPAHIVDEVLREPMVVHGIPDQDTHIREVLQRVLGDARFAQVVAEAQRVTLTEVFALMRADAEQDGVVLTVTGTHAVAERPSGVGEHRVLDLRLLGGLTLRHPDARPEASGPSGKVRELLAFLTLHSRSTKEQIGLALWPEASSAQLRNSFHVTLHHLRRLLGPEAWIPFDADCYRLDRAPGSDAMLIVDVDAIQDAAHEVLDARRRQRPTLPEQRRAWMDTLRNGGEELLGTLTMGEWLEPCRDRYRLLWGDAMEALVRLCLDASELETALEVADELLTREPLREAAHRLLIECHLARAEPARAIEHYRRLERTLAEAVGARPSAETRALLARATSAG